MKASFAVVPLLALAVLVGCSAANPKPNQRGPLEVGSEKGSPENILCVLQLKVGETIGLGETVANPGSDPVQILSVDLTGAHNLQQNDAKAWPVGGTGAMYYWSDAEHDDDAARTVASMPQAEGFVVEPGAVANVAAVVTIPQAGQQAGAHQLVVRYMAGGRRYAELTNITYELEPKRCE